VNRTRSRHTRERNTRPTTVHLLRILGFAALVLSTVGGAPSLAAPIELKANVVWVRGDRVYVASAESLALQEGDLLRFQAGKKEIATGAVVDVRDPAMIVASLASGSFAKQKKLEKVRIFAERPALRRFSFLRVGCPSSSRPCLLFACEGATIGTSLPRGLYRADSLSERWYRFVRNATVTLDAPWPDTLYVRTFDESADEEIALERGELDVAVFWPGELSAHIREDARWRGFLYGVRSVGCVFSAGPVDVHREALAALNRAIFMGDLAAVGLSGGAVADTTLPPPPLRDVRLEVDRSIPEYATIQRTLDQDMDPRPSRSRLTVRIGYEALPVGERGVGMPKDSAATILSAIRCPVVSNAKLRKTLTALGPNTFADLLGCGVNRASPR